MTNLIEKKDRRFPLGVIPLALYILLTIVASVIVAVGSMSQLGVSGMIGGAIGAIFGSLFVNLLYTAMIVLLVLKIHHWTQVIPVAILTVINGVGLIINFFSTIVNVIAFFTKALVSGGIIDVIGSITSLFTGAITFLGWGCYIILILLATKKGGKLPRITKLLAVGSALIFISGILSNIIAIITFAIDMINGTMPVISGVIVIVGTLTTCIAYLVGAIAIIMNSIWFINPAKRGYVPAEIAEEIPAEAFEEGTAPLAAEEVAEEVTAEAAE